MGKGLQVMECKNLVSLFHKDLSRVEKQLDKGKRQAYPRGFAADEEFL